MKEFPDRISPVELGIIARFSTGLLSITMSEHVDATPGMDVNTSLLFLTDFTGAKSISLSSSSVTSVHSRVINITLTEAQRVGGDKNAPPMPPMLKQGLGNVIGNVLSLLTGHAPGGGKVYPFPLECEGELKHQCMSVLRVCHQGEKCNLECMAKNPPNISKACRAKHPCALSAEKLCEHVQDSIRSSTA